jgi:hypothetical protein
MRIQFDELNLYAEMAGDANGLQRAEVKEHAPKLWRPCGTSGKASDADVYGFPKLPRCRARQRHPELCQGRARIFDTVLPGRHRGSALGAWALDCGVRGLIPHSVHIPRPARLVVLDNVDPRWWKPR